MITSVRINFEVEKHVFHSANRTIDMVLEDVTELYVLSKKPTVVNYMSNKINHSDYAGNQEKLPKILLNGNNVCMVSPETPSAHVSRDADDFMQIVDSRR